MLHILIIFLATLALIAVGVASDAVSVLTLSNAAITLLHAFKQLKT